MEYSKNNDFKLSYVFISVFVGLIVFAVTYILALGLTLLISYLVFQVGLFRFLIGWATDGIIEYPILLISAGSAYLLLVFLLEKINNNYLKSLMYSYLIIGIIILIFQIVFLIINIINGNTVLFNIAQMIVGIILFFKFRSVREEIKEPF